MDDRGGRYRGDRMNHHRNNNHNGGGPPGDRRQQYPYRQNRQGSSSSHESGQDSSYQKCFEYNSNHRKHADNKPDGQPGRPYNSHRRPDYSNMRPGNDRGYY